MAPVLVRIHVVNPPGLGKQLIYTTSSQRERERYTIGGPSASHPPPCATYASPSDIAALKAKDVDEQEVLGDLAASRSRN
jgi:hypothetical protein